MARSSEPRPKVIKIPILIEDNNNSGGQQQQAGSCGNWPPGGQPEEAAAAAAASWRTAGEQSGRREAAGGGSSRTRIIPIRLSDDDRLGSSSTDGHSPAIVASGGGDGAGVGVAHHGRQRPGGSDTAAAGISGLRARLAGSRTNSLEEAARPSPVKVEIGGSSARVSGTSPLPPSSSEMAETLVKASSASASDIWYVKQFERENLTTL
jgi:hypothetical protein